jgi:hypothetical protein
VSRPNLVDPIAGSARARSPEGNTGDDPLMGRGWLHHRNMVRPHGCFDAADIHGVFTLFDEGGIHSAQCERSRRRHCEQPSHSAPPGWSLPVSAELRRCPTAHHSNVVFA